MRSACGYSDSGGLIEALAAESAGLPEKAAFIQKIKELGEGFEHRRKALLEADRIPPAAGILSEKELQIALMIAQRRTNREIAEQLYLSEGTVKQYINRIYSKLGMASGLNLSRPLRSLRKSWILRMASILWNSMR